MKPFLYRRPFTGNNVQGLLPEHEADNGIEAVRCTACNRTHLVSRDDHKILGTKFQSEGSGGE